MSQVTAQDLKSLFPDLDNIIHVKDGGQKYVFNATDANGINIVIKILKNIQNAGRLNREIAAVQSINSPHVPKIFSHGKHIHNGDDYYYVTEQMIDGEDLETLLGKKRAFTTKEIMECVEVLLDTCVKLEEKGIVHRDIKPSNIILDTNENFWLLDFGIARHLNLESLTNTNAQTGPHSPGYSPPEMFRNSKRDIDGRADLFGIGVTIHEMITGSNPFRQGAQNPLEVLRNTETMSLPLLSIQGDTQSQLGGLISVFSDRHISRRPRTVKEAFDWFKVLKPTVQI